MKTIPTVLDEIKKKCTKIGAIMAGKERKAP